MLGRVQTSVHRVSIVSLYSLIKLAVACVPAEILVVFELCVVSKQVRSAVLAGRCTIPCCGSWCCRGQHIVRSCMLSSRGHAC